MVCTKCGFCSPISLRNNGLKSYRNSMTRDFFKVNMLVDIVDLREKIIPECSKLLAQESPLWLPWSSHYFSPSWASVTSSQLEPLALRTAYSGVSCTQAVLRWSFLNKIPFLSCCSIQQGRRINTHRRKSKFSSRYSRNTHSDPNALTSLTWISSKRETVSPPIGPGRPFMGGQQPGPCCLSVQHRSILQGPGSSSTTSSLNPSVITVAHWLLPLYFLDQALYHTHWHSITNCFSDRGLAPWTWMSTSQTQSPRLTCTLLLRTHGHRFTHGINSNERKGSVQPLWQIKKPLYLVSILESRVTLLSCHLSLKCLNSFKYSP